MIKIRVMLLSFLYWPEYPVIVGYNLKLAYSFFEEFDFFSKMCDYVWIKYVYENCFCFFLEGIELISVFVCVWMKCD